MVMQGDECTGPGLPCVDRGVLVGMRRRRLGPRLSRTHALCEPCVCRTGISPSVCGRRTRAELHIQDMPPRMLPSSAALRRGASCRHPCCSFPCSGLRAHGTLHSPRPSIGEAMQALASLSASARCRVGVGPWECRILERSRISRPCMQDPQYGLRRITLLRGWVNKGLSSLLRRLAPEPRDPSCDGYGQPDGYELAYSVPCPNPHQHLPKEAPRVQDAPIHVALHVTPKWGVLPALQVRIPYNQH